MKRLLIVTSVIVLALAFTAPASADVICGYYPGTSAYGDRSTTWCGWYGGGCSNCYDTDWQTSCSANAPECEPTHPPTYNMTDCATPKPAPTTQVASQSRKGRVSDLKAGQLL